MLLISKLHDKDKRSQVVVIRQQGTHTFEMYLRRMQTDATSHNIVGHNDVGSCWHLLRGACKRTQHLPTFVCARLAQLVRSLTAIQEVPGSSPGLVEG